MNDFFDIAQGISQKKHLMYFASEGSRASGYPFCHFLKIKTSVFINLTNQAIYLLTFSSKVFTEKQNLFSHEVLICVKWKLNLRWREIYLPENKFSEKFRRVGLPISWLPYVAGNCYYCKSNDFHGFLTTALQN